ncbi:hypothetical protein [Aeoliella mucimassa]|uniref:Uncharacterized protein n=1 Tax=Aeoliella mucimassa TaxID=2527972 RepID=A0A518ANY6_9BACT|nr:hypothetical protein [Aeoliella mucimassa]QDU56432.1 hypothetical protein Pan181_26410 [Aeoliella mucimassa]
MTEEMARNLFIAIMMVGGLVWLVALSLALRIGKSPTVAPDFDWEHPDQPHPSEDSGSITVPGNTHDASTRLARAILQANQQFDGVAYRIVERSDRQLLIEKVGSYSQFSPHQHGGAYFSGAEFTFATTRSNQVEVTYQLDFTNFARRQRTIALALILGLGLPVLALAGLLIWNLVIFNPQPGARWQVMQTLQIVHVLWPPFLPIGIYNFGRRSAKIWVENVLASLQIVDLPQTA